MDVFLNEENKNDWKASSNKYSSVYAEGKLFSYLWIHTYLWEAVGNPNCKHNEGASILNDLGQLFQMPWPNDLRSVQKTFIDKETRKVLFKRSGCKPKGQEKSFMRSSSPYSFLISLTIKWLRKIDVSCISGPSAWEFNTEICFSKTVKSAAWGNFGNQSKAFVTLPPPDFLSTHRNPQAAGRESQLLLETWGLTYFHSIYLHTQVQKFPSWIPESSS